MECRYLPCPKLLSVRTRKAKGQEYWHLKGDQEGSIESAEDDTNRPFELMGISSSRKGSILKLAVGDPGQKEGDSWKLSSRDGFVEQPKCIIYPLSQIYSLSLALPLLCCTLFLAVDAAGCWR